MDESWCKHLTRLEALQEEMVLQTFNGEKDLLQYYENQANSLFGSLIEDVRRNTVYSMFVYKPTTSSGTTSTTTNTGASNNVSAKRA
jgi:preprotein translocase subunit SecA